MRYGLNVLPMLCLLAFMAGCASKHAVVLVADPDGHVGQAEVVTEGGKERLEKSGDMTSLAGKAAPPGAVVAADTRYIETVFAGALAIEPPPAEKFILYFETGGDTLTPDSQAAIADIVAAIKRRGAITVRVSGHSDSVGSVQVNDAISLKRAKRVREFLVQNGTSPDRILVSSHGKGNPMVQVPDGVAEPRNRRVEVVVR